MADESLSVEQAEELLRQHGGYDWLLAGPDVWGVSNIVEQLARMGMQVSADTVQRWVRDLAHTQNMGGMGYWASRGDLMMFFASRMRKAHDQVG